MSHGEVYAVLGLREPLGGLHIAEEQTILLRGDGLTLRMSIEFDAFINGVPRGLGQQAKRTSTAQYVILIYLVGVLFACWQTHW